MGLEGRLPARRGRAIELTRRISIGLSQSFAWAAGRTRLAAVIDDSGDRADRHDRLLAVVTDGPSATAAVADEVPRPVYRRRASRARRRVPTRQDRPSSITRPTSPARSIVAGQRPEPDPSSTHHNAALLSQLDLPKPRLHLPGRRRRRGLKAGWSARRGSIPRRSTRSSS